AWLILGDRGGQGRRLAERLSSMGAVCEEVAADALYGGCADGASRAAALTRTLRNAGGRAWAGAVHLYALEAAAAREGAVSDGLDVQVEGACASVLQLAQACAALEPGAAPRVFVVTRGAQPVSGDESYLKPAQATIWGLARTVDLEHPTLP